jgi:hypothetical protein
MNSPEPVNVADYVRESFDGVVGEELGPFDYSADDATRDNDQAAAVDIIAADLSRRFGHGLSTHEMVLLVIWVAGEWQRRKLEAGERAGMREAKRMLNGDNVPRGVDRATLRESGRIR